VAVIDGKEYPDVLFSGFSPCSEHYASWKKLDKDKYAVIIDGK